MFHVQKAKQVIRLHHPLVRDAYLTKEQSLGHAEQDVLVIEARNSGDDEDMDFGSFDSYLYNLVTDLQNLREQVKKQAGSIDRVDIFTH